MTLRVLMVYVFLSVPLVTVFLVGPGGLTCFFGGGPAGPGHFLSGVPEAQNLVRVLILAKIVRTCTCVLLWLLHVLVGGGGGGG